MKTTSNLISLTTQNEMCQSNVFHVLRPSLFIANIQISMALIFKSAEWDLLNVQTFRTGLKKNCSQKNCLLMENKKYSVVVVPTFNDTFVDVKTRIIRVW